jgi:isoquinoline 1-oxidoreductase beta subunit
MVRKTSRRKFLLGTAVVAGGGLALTWLSREPDSLATGPDVLEPNAFLQITPTGQFIFQLDKVEMGQGTMTGLATLVAEELDLDPARLDVRFAPVLPTFQRPIQMTGQSLSMVDSWNVLRETGAAARAMLLTAAARRWGVVAGALQTDDGEVIDPATGTHLPYGELAADAAQLQPPRSVQLKSPEQYRWIGKHVPRLDAHVKVTGEAVYGIDIQVDGMLTAVIARCPELGATVTSFDATEAASMPGVRGIVPLPHGVAVVAEDFWTARQAAKRVRLEFAPGPLAAQSDATILAEQRAQFARADADADYRDDAGESAAVPEAAAEFAAGVVEGEYITPYLAHAPMEPLNATVHVRTDACTIWVPTQAPDMARQVACDRLGLNRAQVQVHTTYLGGGFGRRFMWDFVAEAIDVAREFAVPVKLMWTREDDIQHGYYRQLTVHRMRGVVDDAGDIAVWMHRQAVAPTGEVLTPPTIGTLLPESLPASARLGFGKWLGRKTVDWMGAFQAREGAATVPYAMAGRSFVQFVNDPGMPVSIWRSVGNSYNAFVVESFIDELAAAAGDDPLEFRRARLAEHPRHRAVIDRLRAESEWDLRGQGAAGRYLGIAVHESFGTVVGQVAEVSVTPDAKIRVHRVVCVVDCGIAVNPDIVRQQMEGGIIFGLTAALYGEINLDSGRVRQSNYHDYRMVRMRDAPAIDVHIVSSENSPTGVGEPATPVIAPAVANAVFAATGKRLRALPLRLR